MYKNRFEKKTKVKRTIHLENPWDELPYNKDNIPKN